MPLLDGEQAPFRTAAQRRALVGCTIRYLRHGDIDRSGRGYFFPRTATVEAHAGRQLVLTDGNSLMSSDLVEIVIVQHPGGDGP